MIGPTRAPEACAVASAKPSAFIAEAHDSRRRPHNTAARDRAMKRRSKSNIACASLTANTCSAASLGDRAGTLEETERALADQLSGAPHPEHPRDVVDDAPLGLCVRPTHGIAQSNVLRIVSGRKAFDGEPRLHQLRA